MANTLTLSKPCLNQSKRCSLSLILIQSCACYIQQDQTQVSYLRLCLSWAVIHVSPRCIAHRDTSALHSGLGPECELGAAWPRIVFANPSSSWRRWCCTLSRPRHRERVRAAHSSSSSSSSRAGGTFGQLWLVVHWTCRQPLGRNTAPRRQQREYCQYYPPLFQNISSNQLLCATVARK